MKRYENKRVLYIDANNLYVYELCQPLAYDKHHEAILTDTDAIMNVPDDGDAGAFVQVDLGCFDKINHQNSPVAPEKKFNIEDRLLEFICVRRIRKITLIAVELSNCGPKRKTIQFIMAW